MCIAVAPPSQPTCSQRNDPMVILCFKVPHHGRRWPLRLSQACLVSCWWLDVGEGTTGLEAEHRLVGISISLLSRLPIKFTSVLSGVAVAILGVCLISTFNVSRSLEVRYIRSHFNCFALNLLLQHRPNPPMRWIPSMLWSKQKV